MFITLVAPLDAYGSSLKGESNRIENILGNFHGFSQIFGLYHAEDNHFEKQKCLKLSGNSFEMIVSNSEKFPSASNFIIEQTEVGTFYWTVLAPDIVNPGREERFSIQL